MNQFDMRSQNDQFDQPEKSSTAPTPERHRPWASRQPRRLGRLFSLRTLVGILTILLVAALAAVFYFYRQTVSPDEGSATQVSHAILVVGKLMVLPQGETPTVATVSDPQKLQDQTFFAKAEKGDLVLIYPQAHKAILYSPRLNKIVEVAPINLTNQAPAVLPSSGK